MSNFKNEGGTVINWQRITAGQYEGTQYDIQGAPHDPQEDRVKLVGVWMVRKDDLAYMLPWEIYRPHDGEPWSYARTLTEAKAEAERYVKDQDEQRAAERHAEELATEAEELVREELTR